MTSQETSLRDGQESTPSVKSAVAVVEKALSTEVITPKPRLKPVLLLTVLSVAFGTNFGIYNSSVVNNLKPAVVSYLNISGAGSWISSNPETVWAITVSAFTAGSAVGTLCSTPLAENLGRKKGLITSGAINVLGGLMCVFYLNVFELALIGRLLMGISLGLGIPLASAFITEISPVAYRGRLNAVLQTAFGLGDLVGMILSMSIILGTLERSNYALSLTLLLSLLQILVLCFSHDSPRFLILMRNRLDEGQMALEYYQGKSVAIEVVKEIESERNIKSVDGTLVNTTPASLNGIDAGQGYKKQSAGRKFWKYFTRKPFILACLLLTANALTGITTIVSFSTDAFLLNGVPKYAEMCTVGLGLSNFVGSFIAIGLMESWGRKPLMTCGLAGCFCSVCLFTTFSLILSYVPLSPYYAYSVVVSLILFLLFFSLNGASLNTLAAEICPQTYRSLAISMANFCLMFFSTVNILLYEPFKEWFGYQWVFFPASVVSMLLGLYLIRAVPETKNKSITEIKKHFEH